MNVEEARQAIEEAFRFAHGLDQSAPVDHRTKKPMLIAALVRAREALKEAPPMSHPQVGGSVNITGGTSEGAGVGGSVVPCVSMPEGPTS